MKFDAVALYRYARVPLDRYVFGRRVSVVFHKGDKPDIEQMRRSGFDVFAKQGVPKRKDFFARWAPWLLSGREAQIATDVALPGFVSDFCKKHGIKVVPLNGATGRSRGKSSGRASGPHPSFRAFPGAELKAQLARDLPLFLYFPWIPEHGDTLIGKIDGSEAFALAPFDLINGHDSAETRRDVLRYARANPDHYRRMVIRRLVPLRDRIKGFIVTFDWSPVMRIVVNVCHELGIPTILIPHESVFVDRQKYYWCPKAKASVPVSDVILGWGRLQQDIFLERAYPAERFISVGAPKFDVYHDYAPQLSREQLHGLFGLSGSKKTMLFASQPLDSQLNSKIAREAQRQAILDLMAICEAMDAQLIVRLPPSRDDILGTALRSTILSSDYAAYDDATCYLVSPEEALYHADIVTSINSTMLFEGSLLGRPALSMKYVEFDPFWENAGIPAAQSREEAEPLVRAMLLGEWRQPQAGIDWAATMFGIGRFDGQAVSRIRAFLTDFAAGRPNVLDRPRPDPMARLFEGEPIDVAAVAFDPETVASERHRYLGELLQARSLQSSLASIEDVASADLFVQLSDVPDAAQQQHREVARLLARPTLFVEDGLLQPSGRVLPQASQAPQLSIVIDDQAPFQDATRPTRLETRLQQGPELSAEQRRRAEAAIGRLNAARTAKAGVGGSAAGLGGVQAKPVRKILVVDEPVGAPAVSLGLAGPQTFGTMLREVAAAHPEAEIIVKLQPSGSAEATDGHLTGGAFKQAAGLHANIREAAANADLCDLFAQVDEVHVVTATAGFEAVMAGKTVHVHGMPFYAGWGVTTDRLQSERRGRPRSAAEIFHFAYIEASRYCEPLAGRGVDVEAFIDG